MIHRVLVIAGAIVAIAAASVVFTVYRVPNDTTPQRPRPSPTALAVRETLTCQPTELKLTGVFNECASIGKGTSCPSGSFDQAREMLLNGTKDTFLLYIEVNGGYHGPGTYALAPWPQGTLGVADGVAKVAIREFTTGALWESSAGSVTIEGSEQFGWVYAGLGASSSSPVDVSLNIAGWWSCS
ncbi:MAG TPA: hypothetical protein VGG90_03700 [Candidatus Dormibacteraeota bacterium]|jgi:hypothetical protein